MSILQRTRRVRGNPRRGGSAPSLVSRLLFALVALSILFPALAGSLAARPLQTTGVFEDRIVICTGSGLKVIRLDNSGEALPDGEEQYDIAPGLCAPMVTAALGEFRDGLFIQLRRPALPDLLRPAAAILVPHGTEHPPALTRGPPVHV